jgi:hypothetical protein
MEVFIPSSGVIARTMGDGGCFPTSAGSSVAFTAKEKAGLRPAKNKDGVWAWGQPVLSLKGDVTLSDI